MNIEEILELMDKYWKCPECGNEYLGNEQGGILVTVNAFRRWCKCGCEIAIKQED